MKVPSLEILIQYVIAYKIFIFGIKYFQLKAANNGK